MLTDERIEEIFKGIDYYVEPLDFVIGFAREIESATRDEEVVRVETCVWVPTDYPHLYERECGGEARSEPFYDDYMTLHCKQCGGKIEVV